MTAESVVAVRPPTNIAKLPSGATPMLYRATLSVAATTVPARQSQMSTALLMPFELTVTNNPPAKMILAPIVAVPMSDRGVVSCRTDQLLVAASQMSIVPTETPLT